MSGFLPGLRKKQYGYILKSGISSDIFRSRVTCGIALIRKKIMKTSYDRNIAVRDHRFDEFYEKFIKLSGGGTLEDLSGECKARYSSILLGFDQLWLPQNIAADYYTLRFAEAVNKVTYATSFGVSELPENIVENARDFLSKIDSIYVIPHYCSRRMNGLKFRQKIRLFRNHIFSAIILQNYSMKGKRLRSLQNLQAAN